MSNTSKKHQRIVQITDTHVVDDYTKSVLSWDPQEALSTVLTSINSLPVTPSLILATGDLVHDGSVESYSALKSTLTRQGLPVFVLPGNHDSVQNISSSLISEKISMIECLEVENSNWAVIFINTKVPHEEHGAVTQENLDQLSETYDSLQGKHCLIAMHHSLTPECLAPACQLQGSEGFLDFLSQHSNIRAVISGHTHCQTESEHEGIKLLTTPSTLFHVTHSQKLPSIDNSEFMKFHEFDGNRKGYRILDLFEDGSIESQVCWA